MKVLFLNPQIDAEHVTVRALEAAGYAVLVARSSEEASQVLVAHGDSIDLAIVRRDEEANSLGWIAQLRSNPQAEDLPVIITYSGWSDAEASAHQSTPEGGDAYLRAPYQDVDLIDLVQKFDEVEGAPAAGPSVEPTPSGVVILERPAELEVQMEPIEPPEFVAPEAAPPVASVEDSVSGVIDLEVIEEASSSEANLSVSLTSDRAEVSSQAVDASQSNLVEQVLNEESDLNLEEEVARHMPYLAGSQVKMTYERPVGDAIVPGGAVETPDLDTLKKYLRLREQDVGILSSQLQTAQEQVDALLLRAESAEAQVADFEDLIREKDEAISRSSETESLRIKELEKKLEESEFRARERRDRVRSLERDVVQATEEIDRIRERVRVDIRKIRVRERELENRLEILKHDSESLIRSRENKVLELKRKLDLTEFNMDLLQDQYAKEKSLVATLREKLSKAAKVVRMAGGFLDEDGNEISLDDDSNQEAAS